MFDGGWVYKAEKNNWEIKFGRSMKIGSMTLEFRIEWNMVWPGMVSEAVVYDSDGPQC